MKNKMGENVYPSAVNRKYLYLAAFGTFFLLVVFLVDLDQLRANALQNLQIDALAKEYRRLANLLDEKKSRRLPHCIIIGARKCGTRALLDAIALHPLVKPARYEVHYFDTNETYARGYDWYKAQMPLSSSGEITIEKTPGYFSSSMAPERIFQMNESIKLILIVRNPVIRTISDFTQVYYTKQTKNKTQLPFASVAFDKSGRLLENYKPVRNSLYSKHLLRWLKYFPLDQILIVDGDRFISEPLAEVRRVERFLQLEPQIHSSQMYYNRTKGFFCFRPADGKPPKCLGETKGRPHVQIGAEAETSLRRQLMPYNQKFFKLIGRSFDW